MHSVLFYLFHLNSDVLNFEQDIVQNLLVIRSEEHIYLKPLGQSIFATHEMITYTHIFSKIFHVF